MKFIKYIRLFWLLCTWWVFPSQAQSILNSTGMYVLLNGYQVDYNVGELTMTETFSIPGGMLLSQGFLQPNSAAGGGNFPDIVVRPDLSPNGDGQGNETLYIENIELYPDNEIQIFNRWGSLIYVTKSYDNAQRSFSGKANTGMLLDNKEVPDGTYYYILKVNDSSFPRTLVLNGFFVLKRK